MSEYFALTSHIVTVNKIVLKETKLLLRKPIVLRSFNYTEVTHQSQQKWNENS